MTLVVSMHQAVFAVAEWVRLGGCGLGRNSTDTGDTVSGQ